MASEYEIRIFASPTLLLATSNVFVDADDDGDR